MMNSSSDSRCLIRRASACAIGRLPGASQGLKFNYKSGVAKELRILCVIDNLKSGGAQSQMVKLVSGLKSRGFQILLVHYGSERDFWLASISGSGIETVHIKKKYRFSLLVPVRITRILRQFDPVAIVSFLPTPNVYCELSRILKPSTRLIVSERSLSFGGLWVLAQRIGHLMSTVVVANSQELLHDLAKHRWLKRKLRYIPNGFDVKPVRIRPLGGQSSRPSAVRLRLLAVGRVAPEKNTLGLIQAIALMSESGALVPDVFWVGRLDGIHENDKRYFTLCKQLVARYPQVERHWHWWGERADVDRIMSTFDGLIHPALNESMPNVVGEAMSQGLPVLASQRGQFAQLIQEGRTGFLFDPTIPMNIARVIQQYSNLNPAERAAIAQRAQRMIANQYGVDKMVDAYVACIQANRKS